MATRPSSLVLLFSLAACLTVSAAAQPVALGGEGLPVMPNQGALAGQNERMPAVVVPEAGPGRATARVDPAFPDVCDEPASEAYACPSTPAVVAGTEIPQAERDQFRATWGLEPERKLMRQRLREAGREPGGSLGAARRDHRSPLWRDWRYRGYDSLDRLLFLPERGVREGRRGWSGRAWGWNLPGLGAPESRGRARSSRPPLRPEYQGPWPWDDAPDQPASPRAAPGETIREL